MLGDNWNKQNFQYYIILIVSSAPCFYIIIFPHFSSTVTWVYVFYFFFLLSGYKCSNFISISKINVCYIHCIYSLVTKLEDIQFIVYGLQSTWSYLIMHTETDETWAHIYMYLSVTVKNMRATIIGDKTDGHRINCN